MGSIKGFVDHALAENEARKLNFKYQKKGKEKTPTLERKSSQNRQMNLLHITKGRRKRKYINADIVKNVIILKILV